jgi:hypothetical protein
VKPSICHRPQATLPPPNVRPADGAASSISSLQNPVSTGFRKSKRSLPGVFPARAAIDFIVNEASPSAAERHSSLTCAVSPRSGFVAHSHAPTHTASACRVSASSRKDAQAARLENIVSSSKYYQLHSALRTFHAGYLPISLINLTPQRTFEALNASNFKPFKPLAQAERAQSATEFIANNLPVIIISGGSTTLSGANIAANSVKADIGKTFGGDLIIESLQDKSVFAEKSKSSGFSASIPITGGNFGASVSSGKTNINSNFQSVGQQSGIQAGDGGFQVNVQGNTTLLGGVITSTQPAVNNKLNSFNTGTRDANGNLAAGTGKLTITDIQNTASYSAKSSNFSAGFSVGEFKDKEGNTVRNPDGSAQTKTTPIGSAGIGSASGNATSVTVAGITGVAGDKTVLTGKDTTNALKPIFNADDVRKDINAQVAITAQFGSNASRAIGTYANEQMASATRLRIGANAEGVEPSERDRLNNEANAIERNWGDQGVLRLAAHTVVGGLTGGANGAVGAAATTIAAPVLYSALRDAGVPDSLATGLTQLGGAAIGAAAGGTAGAAAGLNEVSNNFLVHNRYDARKSQFSAMREEAERCKATPNCDVNAVYERWRGVSAEQQRSARAAIDGLTGLTYDELKKAGDEVGRLLPSLNVNPAEVCATGDARCYNVVQESNRQAQSLFSYYIATTMTLDIPGSTTHGRNPVAARTAADAKSGEIILINPQDLRWTQRTAGGNGRIDDIRTNTEIRGYTGDPIDVVRTPDGVVTVDHTRAAVALEQGITSIPARIHLPNDPLPASMQGRFGSSTTWGEAAAYRAANQRPPLPSTGTSTPPRLPRPNN